MSRITHHLHTTTGRNTSASAARLLVRWFSLLVLASALVFCILSLLPGDPAAIMLGLNASPESVAALHHELGLDRSALMRYLHWIGRLAVGDPGTSLIYNVPVRQLIGERLLATGPLIALAMSLSLGLGIPIGAVAALKRGQAFDLGLMSILQLLKSIPDFWFAMMLTVIFALTLHVVPASGFPGWEHGPFAALEALILPAIALAVPQAAITARFMRSSMIETLGQDYIRTVRAQGLGPAQVLFHVALPNAALPIVTLVGLQIPVLMTGTIIVENVFSIPGCGKLLLDAVNQRDIPVVQAVVMLTVAFVLVLNAGLGVVARWLDPRIAVEQNP